MYEFSKTSFQLTFSIVSSSRSRLGTRMLFNVFNVSDSEVSWCRKFASCCWITSTSTWIIGWHGRLDFLQKGGFKKQCTKNRETPNLSHFGLKYEPRQPITWISSSFIDLLRCRLFRLSFAVFVGVCIVVSVLSNAFFELDDERAPWN